MSDSTGSFVAALAWVGIGIACALGAQWVAVWPCAGAAAGWAFAGMAERKLERLQEAA